MELSRDNLVSGGQSCRILLVGVGSAGCKTLGSLIGHGMDIPESIAIHTDEQALKDSHAPRQFLIGKSIARGLSTGGNVQLAVQCANADKESLRDLFGHFRMIFFIVGLGGGTGNGAGPIFVEMAREEGAFTLCMAVMPFEFEGDTKRIKAESGLARLKELSDGVVVFPNQRLFDLMTDDVPYTEALASADKILSDGMLRLWRLLNEPGVMNLDFADVSQLVRHSNGTCTLASVETTGKNRIEKAMEAVTKDVLFHRGTVLVSAKSVLLGIIAGPETTLTEVDQIHRQLAEVMNHEVVLFSGMVVLPEMEGKLSLTILAAETWIPGPALEPVQTSETSGQTGELGMTLNRRDFEGTEQSIYGGQDLDIPTFIRRGIKLKGG